MHRLRTNKRTAWPSRFIFVDTETEEKWLDENTKELSLRLGVGKFIDFRSSNRIHTQSICRFKDNNTFWDFVESHLKPKSKLIIIAHNWGFDAQILDAVTHIRNIGFKPRNILETAQLSIWKYKRKSTYLECLDNMNIFHSSLKKLGRDIGLPKLDLEEAQESDDRLLTYCERDVDIMVRAWELWRKFCFDHDLGNFAPTVAGQALNTYRHRFMPSSIYIHGSADISRLEREAYFGGRVECFRLGQFTAQDIHMLDVNSLYPYIMSSYPYPTKYIGQSGHITIDELNRLLKTHLAIAEIDIETDEPAYPVRRDKRLIFPIGRFRTVLCGQELAHALALEHVRKAYHVQVYERDFIFEDYVRFFYQTRLNYRKEGNESFAFLCKLFLNSLYGKFGQKQDIWEDIEITDEPDWRNWQVWDFDNKQWLTYRQREGIIQIKVGEKDAFNAFPAIAAHVTANARHYLWSLVDKIGQEHVLYCDTDSLMVDAPRCEIESRLPIGDQLGELKEEWRSSEVTINGCKDYVHDDKIKRKGIRLNARQVDDSTFVQEQFRSLASALRDGETNRQIIRLVKKHLNREYYKGILHPDGKVTPFILWEF